MLADWQGNPLAFTLTGGQQADITEAPTLNACAGQAAAVVADKGYEADALIELLHNQGTEAVIPPRSNRIAPRRYSKRLYKARNLIERLFRRLKEFRRIATRYEKLDRHFPAMIMLACVCVWLN
jgi:transposase